MSDRSLENNDREMARLGADLLARQKRVVRNTWINALVISVGILIMIALAVYSHLQVEKLEETNRTIEKMNEETTMQLRKVRQQMDESLRQSEELGLRIDQLNKRTTAAVAAYEDFRRCVISQAEKVRTLLKEGGVAEAQAKLETIESDCR
jgi:uncharacterized membrane protein YhiD involved in acid resistance